MAKSKQERNTKESKKKQKTDRIGYPYYKQGKPHWLNTNLQILIFPVIEKNSKSLKIGILYVKLKLALLYVKLHINKHAVYKLKWFSSTTARFFEIFVIFYLLLILSSQYTHTTSASL